MTKVLAILAPFVLAFTTSDPAPVVGWASYYHQAPTDATIEYRVGIGDIGHDDLLWADALIAVADCATIGDRVTIQVGEGPMMNAVVFDCAGNDGTVEWMADSNIVLEFDWYTATRYDMPDNGALRVRVWE